MVNIVHGVVNAGRKRKDRLKVGHTGTLDPLASGVLVVAIGAATRLSYLIGEMPKCYHGTFRLNASTDSGDLDGELVLHDLPIPPHAELLAAARNHVGRIDQIPPAHSAIHINGIKAYKRVRAGEKVDMPSRTVRIDQISVTRFEPPEFDIDVNCGGGTYMRTLGADIAIAAGNIAVMTRLVRTAVGSFDLENAVNFETLKSSDWSDQILPLRTAVANLEMILLDDEQNRLVDNGCPLAISRVTRIPSSRHKASGPDFPSGEDFAAINQAGQLRAIMVRQNEELRCTRVFHPPSQSD